VYTRPTQENPYVAIPCPYCAIDHLVSEIDKVVKELGGNIEDGKPCTPVGEQVSEG
jgi:hypothetical protein